MASEYDEHCCHALPERVPSTTAASLKACKAHQFCCATADHTGGAAALALCLIFTFFLLLIFFGATLAATVCLGPCIVSTLLPLAVLTASLPTVV